MSEEKPKKERKKVGRKIALIEDDNTLKRIKALANIQCSQAEAAGAMLVTESTFHLFLKRNIKAQEAWQLGRDEGKASLRRIQWKQAARSTTMAIWLGKQWLGQKDKTLIGGDPGAPPVGIEHSMEQGLTALLIAARREHGKEDE